MININLLPRELTPKKRNFVPHMAIAVLAGVLLFWFGSSLATTHSELASTREELKLLKDDLAKLEDVVNQVRQLEEDKQLLSQKEKAVEQITAGRTVWSHELYVLASLVPDDIWLERVSLSSRRRPVTIDVPNPNRTAGQPPTIKKTVIQSFPALRISGQALSPKREKGVELVGQLMRNMKQDEIFSKRFIFPEMRSIDRQKYKEQTVMKFITDCEIVQ
ncbi:MAG: PilN domain-containing protein [Candidatus Hydrogenedentota bacterium]|nr:MAG: PilN domain-containing protein [Candidatus Hydrogenedentota bacterium]